ncbi:neutral/alkaline non-lysosomal ceramidase N-terminal domain-containing protein [Verrucomicrobiota bacterium]
MIKAGIARIDITPSGPVWMDGMIRSHKSTGVHDPLFARALALSSGDSCFVVVSLDVCVFDTQDCIKTRETASQFTGVPADHIIIAASHTHSGPATVGFFNPKEQTYVPELIEKIVHVIHKAVDSMQPAAAGCASGSETTISHYRRLQADDGHVVMNWEPYPPEKLIGPLGEIDPEVGVLKIVSARDTDTVMGLLFNHAGHPNVMSGDNYLISADYPGLAAALVEEANGGTAMFVNGTQGTMDIDGLRDRDWEGLERVAKALAKVVTETAKTITFSKSAFIRGASTSYAIPHRKITDGEFAWAEKILKRTGGKVQPLADGVGDDYKASIYKELRGKQDQDVQVQQICFAVDDCAFISSPGEVFTEIGMQIKAQSPFRHTYILGVANGSIGYVPTRKAILEGGYAVDTRRLDASAEEVIIEQSLSLLRKVMDTT